MVLSKCNFNRFSATLEYTRIMDNSKKKLSEQVKGLKSKAVLFNLSCYRNMISVPIFSVIVNLHLSD